ncbi:MAG: dodecin domain-containing protein [Nitrososphaeraceae archaeon]|nr:dodecin domain-containing protein [Nitrososphaeraceae archaeon]
MTVVKILELIGTSTTSWEDAAQTAVSDALKTIHGIRGVEVRDMTAEVDPSTGKITKYKTCVKLAFIVEN